MKSEFNTEKNLGLPFLLTGILAFFIIWFLNGYDKQQNEPAHIAKKFQKNFLKVEEEARKNLILFTENFLRNKRGAYKAENGRSYGDRFRFQGTFMVTSRDTLIYWSDNIVPVPIEYFSQIVDSSTVIKFKNGWYHVSFIRKGLLEFWLFTNISHEYPIQNDFLTDGLNPVFGTSGQVIVIRESTGFPVYSCSGKHLFSLTVKPTVKQTNQREVILFLLTLCGFLGVIIFLYRLSGAFTWILTHKKLYVAGFCSLLGLLRFLQLYWSFPADLYNTPLFGPGLYSSSIFQPSLGDFVINSVLLLISAYVFYRHWPSSSHLFSETIWQQSVRYIVWGLMIVAMFSIGTLLISTLIINSTIPINFQDISSFAFSSLWGILIICFILLSILIITLRIIENQLKKRVSIPAILLILFFLSAYATLVLNNANRYKESETRKILAIKLAGRRNPVTEVLYEKLERKILSNAEKIIQSSNESSIDDSLADQLKKINFSDDWDKFNIQITVCSTGKELKVQPQGYEVNCDEYFRNIISTIGESTSAANLFFLDYGIGSENYLACIPVSEKLTHGLPGYWIYVELNAKTPYKDLGYPELLMDKKRTEIPDLADYSYAIYQNGHLVHAVGNFAYRVDLISFTDTNRDGAFFTRDGADHYLYPINKSNILLVSRVHLNWLDLITPFSYLFILLALFSLLFYSLFHISQIPRLAPATFKDRLQVFMIGILLLSFIIVGAVSGLNIIRINAVKNEINLRERAVSVLIEMQHKFGNTTSLKGARGEEMDNVMVKFANVFFTDINVYDVQGQIVSSSRPQIFDEGLVSDRINAEAYDRLSKEKRSIVIQEESIGKLAYSSAYLPLFNDRGTLLGYLNLPYFSRQDELKKEVSAVLVTVVNIYVLMVLFGVILIFFLSRYITYPLALLAGKLGRLQLGRKNEKIDWKRGDEIGKLVEQYNRMVEELEESAERLARSEREGAWREMARQVAHEIKNPLTPMKLSIQYMQKAWAEKAPDREQRFDRFSRILIEQIDALSSIASEFSDFAKMPAPVNENLDLNEVLGSILTMYSDLENITFIYEPAARDAIIFADRKQLLRMFANLLNNAVQAIGDRADGMVRIGIKLEKAHYLISISDNGSGISADQSVKIFQPNFTTKTGGMGLGLAIVKGIIDGMKGDITFDASIGGGTTFTLLIPALNDPETDQGK